MGEVHHLIAAAAGNACLSDAIAPLQSLPRRYWYHHVRDAASEMAKGARLLRGIVDADLGRDPERAARTSIALNNYLVDFTHAVAAPPRPSAPTPSPTPTPDPRRSRCEAAGVEPLAGPVTPGD